MDECKTINYKGQCHHVTAKEDRQLPTEHCGNLTDRYVEKTHEEKCMNLLNKHHITVSENKFATKYDTVNRECMAVTNRVCSKIDCTMKCRDMTTQECRPFPMEPWAVGRHGGQAMTHQVSEDL